MAYRKEERATVHTYIWLPMELFPNAAIILSLHIEQTIFSQGVLQKGKHHLLWHPKPASVFAPSCVLTPVPSLLCYYQSPAPAPQVKHNRSINKEVLISMTASLADLMCSCHLSWKTLLWPLQGQSASSSLVQGGAGWYGALAGYTLLMLYCEYTIHKVRSLVSKKHIWKHFNRKQWSYDTEIK